MCMVSYVQVRYVQGPQNRLNAWPRTTGKRFNSLPNENKNGLDQIENIYRQQNKSDPIIEICNGKI